MCHCEGIRQAGIIISSPSNCSILFAKPVLANGKYHKLNYNKKGKNIYTIYNIILTLNMFFMNAISLSNVVQFFMVTCSFSSLVIRTCCSSLQAKSG